MTHSRFLHRYYCSPGTTKVNRKGTEVLNLLKKFNNLSPDVILAIYLSHEIEKQSDSVWWTVMSGWPGVKELLERNDNEFLSDLPCGWTWNLPDSRISERWAAEVMNARKYNLMIADELGEAFSDYIVPVGALRALNDGHDNDSSWWRRWILGNRLVKWCWPFISSLGNHFVREVKSSITSSYLVSLPTKLYRLVLGEGDYAHAQEKNPTTTDAREGTESVGTQAAADKDAANDFSSKKR